MMPNHRGWCERTDKAIQADRDLQAQLGLLDDPTLTGLTEDSLKKKDNIILELNHRILEWNQSKCPECHASLEGKGPQLMDEREARYHGDRDWTDNKSISPIHTKDAKNQVSSEAVASLKAILGKR